MTDTPPDDLTEQLVLAVRQLNETMLLGIVALRAGQGRKILYDGARMRITNAPDAEQYLTREYRKGWEV